jgi:hypothetical protein
VAAARVEWHGQDLPVVKEIVSLGEVQTSVEIPEFGELELRQIVGLLTSIDRFEKAARLAPHLLLELVAWLYIKHGGTPETWRAYTASLGVPQSKTRQPASMFQPFLRWANGSKPDTTGRLTKLAATLDDWFELGDKRPSPITSSPGSSEFAEWLRKGHGYTNIAGGRREPHDEYYSKSEPENVLPFERHVDLPCGEASRSSSETRPRGEAKYLALRATKGSDEWYTPPHIFEAMGCTFDLDPASPGKDIVFWIPARKHFTINENGLEQDWGNLFVFLNPPYSLKGLPLWIEKFRQHKNGVLVCVDRTSARWWHRVCGSADAILQVNKTINFLNPDNDPKNHNALGSSLVANGPKGVEALINAAGNGLGTLFVPHEKFRALARGHAVPYSESNSEPFRPRAARLRPQRK